MAAEGEGQLSNDFTKIDETDLLKQLDLQLEEVPTLSFARVFESKPYLMGKL